MITSAVLPRIDISRQFSPDNGATLYLGDSMEFLRSLPDSSVQLVVTSPPYNLGKEYETRLDMDVYVAQQRSIIDECTRLLAPQGSICWEVGNYVDDGEIFPLDIVLYNCFKSNGLKMRNRIVWHFGHGLHCSRRFSGRYETIMWFTKSDNYLFDLDGVRVPQKYPGKKHYKGPNQGEYSCNPMGKNPSDVWEIPNVKSNHVEKTIHPCQFPVALVQRLVRALSKPGDLVLDPFMGVGSTQVAGVMEGRRVAGAEMVSKYYDIACERVILASEGRLPIRPDQPVYQPTGNNAVERAPRLCEERVPCK